jgi:hypothetical protein
VARRRGTRCKPLQRGEFASRGHGCHAGGRGFESRRPRQTTRRMLCSSTSNKGSEDRSETARVQPLSSLESSRSPATPPLPPPPCPEVWRQIQGETQFATPRPPRQPLRSNAEVFRKPAGQSSCPLPAAAESLPIEAYRLSPTMPSRHCAHVVGITGRHGSPASRQSSITASRTPRRCSLSVLVHPCPSSLPCAFCRQPTRRSVASS